MTRWQRGEAVVERLLAGGDLQTITGAAADGSPWLAKARRTLATAEVVAEADPDSAWTLAYDAARFACVALLTQQGLRATTRGGHYVVEVCVREQFGGQFEQFGGLRRQRNEIEYPTIVVSPLTPDDARAAITLTAELVDAAEKLRPHLTFFE